ncbi:MAG: ABC transporter ATP-binding protein, partial [Vulcanimicrobiaceae bacterium]
VLENVLVGAHARVRGGPWQQALTLGAVAREERLLRGRAREMLALIGLEPAANESATSLALGSQKLLEIARALMSNPRVLLLDEPAAGLNDAETDELAALLLAVRATGITLLVVEHNMSLVMGIADEVLVLDAGRMIACGTPRQIQANERVIEAYVGRGASALVEAAP